MSDAEGASEIQWAVSTSPHIRGGETTARIMWMVVAALTPAGVWSVYMFGLEALHVIMLCVFTAIVTEYFIQRLRGLPQTLSDGSAVVTGLLLAFVLPSHVVVRAADTGVVYDLETMKWYVPVVAAFVAIAIAKHCFGGLGHNIWNPALVGRAFVQASFPMLVNLPDWPFRTGVDGVARATSLAAKAGPHFSVGELFLGYCPGSLGEISPFFLILGAIYLIARRYVDWRLPAGYLVTLAILVSIMAWSGNSGTAGWMNDYGASFARLRAGKLAGGVFAGEWLQYVGRQLFSGGVILGAFFMATDMVTSPLSRKGQLVYGVGCGALTALIRFYSGLPEGVCYAILLMNTVRPYVDKWTRQRVLGEARE